MFGRAALKIHIRKHHEKKEEREVPCDVCGTLVFEKSLNCHKEAVREFIFVKKEKKKYFKRVLDFFSGILSPFQMALSSLKTVKLLFLAV